MASIQNIVDHWVDGCDLHPVDVLGHLLKATVTHIDNGFFIHDKTPLAFPISMLNNTNTLDLTKVIWKTIFKTKQLQTTFLFMCATATRIKSIPDANFTYQQEVFIKIATQIQDLIGMAPLVTSALKAGRYDLQIVVSAGYHYLLSRLHTSQKITEFINTCLSSPWQVVSISMFYDELIYTCHNAAIVSVEAPPRAPLSDCDIIIDGGGRIFVCKHDMVLLIFLFLFSTHTKYIKHSIAELTQRYVPIQLGASIQKKYPNVFKQNNITIPSHFKE